MTVAVNEQGEGGMMGRRRLEGATLVGLMVGILTVSAGHVMAANAEMGAWPAMETQGSASVQTEDQKFKDIYEKEWEWRKKVFWNPDSAETPSNLPEVSMSAQAEHLKYWRHVRQQLDDIDTTKLSPERQIDFGVYVYELENFIHSIEFKEYEMPLSSMSGFWAELNYTASNTYNTEDDYRNYLSMLSQFPRYFGDQIDNMRAGMDRGFMPARIAMKGREKSIAFNAEAKKAEDVSYYKPFIEMPSTMSDERKAALRAQARKVMIASVIPSYQKLYSFVRGEYFPQLRDTIAAYDLPDGHAYYNWKVKEFTTYDQTPEEVHEIGLREVQKIREQMQEIIKEVEFQGDLKDFLEYLRTDPKFYAKTPQEYLKQAAWYSKNFDRVVSKYFGQLPRTRFGIQAFPDEIAPFQAGAAGGRQTYWLNTYNLNTRPLYSLAALTLHESAPGHSFQMSLAAENKDLPDFRRQIYISAYGEGWALYTEKLGVEMGIYETPYDVFGMLSYQMWRAARLVVDTGMHAKGWTRDQAVQYFLNNTAIGEHEVGTEIDRYITRPGQALSYYTGELAIVALREKAETALGDDFDLRAYHDTVLYLGCVPLPVLEARIDRFIEEGGKSPFAKH
jgi:uncharacterized protein (DUF885 family)